MKHVARYAGISVDNDSKNLSFHVTGNGEGKVGMWVEVPSSSTHTFVKLPRAMNKINAARYLLKHKQFKTPMFQKFLNLQIERREEGVTINPRRTETRGYRDRRGSSQQLAA